MGCLGGLSQLSTSAGLLVSAQKIEPRPTSGSALRGFPFRFDDENQINLRLTTGAPV